MPIEINPDKEFVDDMKKRIKSNGGYCPCRLAKTKDTKCMCKEFRDQMERNESGFCHCGLYNYIGGDNEH